MAVIWETLKGPFNPRCESRLSIVNPHEVPGNFDPAFPTKASLPVDICVKPQAGTGYPKCCCGCFTVLVSGVVYVVDGGEPTVIDDFEIFLTADPQTPISVPGCSLLSDNTLPCGSPLGISHVHCPEGDTYAVTSDSGWMCQWSDGSSNQLIMDMSCGFPGVDNPNCVFAKVVLHPSIDIPGVGVVDLTNSFGIIYQGDNNQFACFGGTLPVEGTSVFIQIHNGHTVSVSFPSTMHIKGGDCDESSQSASSSSQSFNTSSASASSQSISSTSSQSSLSSASSQSSFSSNSSSSKSSQSTSSSSSSSSSRGTSSSSSSSKSSASSNSSSSSSTASSNSSSSSHSDDSSSSSVSSNSSSSSSSFQGMCTYTAVSSVIDSANHSSGSGTYSFAGNGSNLQIDIKGGGGGGGVDQVGTVGAQGGGGGGYSSFAVPYTSGDTYTYSVGAAGGRGDTAGAQASGFAGGNSTCSGPQLPGTITSTGGKGGQGTGDGSTGTGAGGTGTTTNGTNGQTSATTAGGAGGNCNGTGGGSGGTVNSNGSDGTTDGAGGGGSGAGQFILGSLHGGNGIHGSVNFTLTNLVWQLASNTCHAGHTCPSVSTITTIYGSPASISSTVTVHCT